VPGARCCPVSQARLLVFFLPPDSVALLACVSKEWRDAARDGVWAEKHAALRSLALSVPPPPTPDACQVQQLCALAAAQDTAFAVPGTRMDITHWNGGNGQYWAAAAQYAGAGSGALFRDEAAVCRAVCWFDVRARVTLPPGAWLLRWRVRTSRPLLETFQLETSAEPADATNDPAAASTPAAAHVADVLTVLVTPVPRALLAGRAPPRAAAVGAWAPVWVPSVAAAAASSAEDDDGSALPLPPVTQQRTVAARWRPLDALPLRRDWGYVPAAVVHVRCAAGATVRAALFKHSNSWCEGVILDCLQAVPLHADGAVFGPLPARIHASGARCVRGLDPEEAGDDPGTAECTARAAPVEAERWAAAHWATRRVGS
jgi:hypothetical protein